MSIRSFRRLPRSARRAMIQSVPDPLTRRILELAFLGPGKTSWARVACQIGGGNSPETVRMRAKRELWRWDPRARTPKPVPFCRSVPCYDIPNDTSGEGSMEKHNERERTAVLVNYDLLAGLPLTAMGNPITAAPEVPYGIDHLIGFNELLTCSSTEGAGVHCYLDDYQFERLWRTPDRYLPALRKFQMVIGPDFSLYTDFPEPLQRWNHYRNQLITAWLQQHGITCIQNASWAGPESFAWCFDGMSPGGTVAVSTVGCAKHPEAQAGFMTGLRELISRLAPTEILVYGSTIPTMQDLLREHGIATVVFPHGMANRMRPETTAAAKEA